MDGLKRLLKSSKFWAAVVGVVSVALVQGLGMDEGSAATISKAILTVVGLYIAGTTAEDFADKINGKGGI